MRTKELLKLHETARQLLEAIEAMEWRRDLYKESERNYVDFMPRIAKRHANNVDTANRAINRLKVSYHKVMTTITESIEGQWH